MNRLLFPLATLTLALPIFLGAGEALEDSPKKIVDDFTTEVNTLEKIFSIVSDEASAKASVPAIEKSSDAIVAIVKRMAAFPKPPEDILKAFAKIVKQSGDDIDTTLRALKTKSPQAASIIDKATSKLGDNPPPEAWLKAVNAE